MRTPAVRLLENEPQCSTMPAVSKFFSVVGGSARRRRCADNRRASRRCDRWSVFPARVDPGALDTRVLLQPCDHGDAALALASADGLAWHAAEFASLARPTVGFRSTPGPVEQRACDIRPDT